MTDRLRAVAILAVILVAGYIGARAAGFVEVTRGADWRLLAVTPADRFPGDIGKPHGEVAASRESAEDMWDVWGTSGPLDLASDEDLVRITAYGSSSCRRFLSGVDIGNRGLVVHLSIGLAAFGGCTADAAPYTHLIAVRAERLPSVPFEIEIRAPDLPGTITITEVR